MAETALVTHLEQVYAMIDVVSPTKEALEHALALARAKVVESIGAKRTKVAPRPVHLDDYIAQRQAKQQSVEDNIREHRLKEAVRTKQELEQKLGLLQENIKSLEAVQEAGAPANHKVSLLDSKVRQEFFTEEDKRRQETAEFAKKLRTEQIELARRNKAREDEMQRKVQAELELAKQQREARETALQAEKSQKLADLQDRARKRKEDLEQRRRATSEETSRLKDQRYMHERLSQDYHARIVQPEQEKQQELLAKQKLLHQPIRLEEIQEHARKHDELMREKQARKDAERQNKMIESQINGLNFAKGSSFTQSVLTQEKQAKIERNQGAETKKRLQEKKQRYALLVKEMFVPAVDPLKQKEMEVIKEKLTHPAPHHIMKNSTTRSLTDNPEAVSGGFKPPKFKPNAMVPKPVPKREPIVVDYLKDQRNARAGSSITSVSGTKADFDFNRDFASDLGDAEKAKFIKSKADKIEKEAKRRELVLSQISPTSPGALEAHENLNDALISSIRAKLSLLG